MMLKPVLLAAWLLALTGCAAPPVATPRSALPAAPSALSGPALLSELARVASLTPEQRRRELVELEGERRLDDARRFQQAALLEREESVEAYERSLRNVIALNDVEPGAQALLDLMKKSLRARIELRQQAARAQELQEKLDQIKALEKSLQQRSAPARTP